MSTKARKARKRAGIRFERKPKVGTPLLERAQFAGMVFGRVRNREVWHWRSPKKLERAAKARGITIPKEQAK